LDVSGFQEMPLEKYLFLARWLPYGEQTHDVIGIQFTTAPVAGVIITWGVSLPTPGLASFFKVTGRKEMPTTFLAQQLLSLYLVTPNHDYVYSQPCLSLLHH